MMRQRARACQDLLASLSFRGCLSSMGHVHFEGIWVAGLTARADMGGGLSYLAPCSQPALPAALPGTLAGSDGVPSDPAQP